eukprot:CAMPEP_0184976932 /NCGR_PEP_ID=MMETSP1098-20130426/7762_1 /TAXON_ID=89044 /ORGANISM="Spumella elongata, Strain CCAP 955/1" /LENGTH=197 /DNA_ID=CAMNT_0027499873 /DNA_START=127 /DNA_END=720 /DNA_ORIENTATION=+
MMFLSTIIAGLLASASADYLRQGADLSSDTTCVCTTVPCPVSGTNTLVNAGGETATYVYAMHSGHAVVQSASTTVVKSNLDKGTDTTSCTQSYSRTLDDDGVQDCDAGHILANRLGGSGNQPINIFPQDLSINRGSYAQYEGTIYDCVMNQGASSAKLSWTFTYSDSTRTKPNGVTYKADYTDGKCADTTMVFTNGA